MHKSNRFIIFIFLVFILHSALAQVRISSPYSRYGLGDLHPNPFAKNMGMGSLSYGVRDSLTMNTGNPASYSSFDSLSFLFDVGISTHFNRLQTASSSQGFNNNTTLGYFTFGFPVTRWWGASIGLTPYSNTGYGLLIKDTVPGIGNVGHEYIGNGSINKFHIGSGFKIFRDLSVGFNASFLFGKLEHVKSVYFSELAYVFDTRITNAMVVNDFNFDAGLQYHHTFNNKLFLNAGLVYQVPYRLSGGNTYLVERFVVSTDTEITRDTIVFDDNVKGKIHIPGGIGGGFMVGKKNYWMLGVDAAWQNWSEYSAFEERDSLQDNLSASFGFQITPKHSSVSSYFRKITYRAGIRFEDTYLNLHTRDISSYAVSLGFGLPFRRSGSSINLALEAGSRGTTSEKLIKETFIRGVLGLTIREHWFFRRKID